MVWNYRVIEHDRFFAIHEVYYNDKGDITAISDPMEPSGQTLEELKGDFGIFPSGSEQTCAKEKRNRVCSDGGRRWRVKAS